MSQLRKLMRPIAAAASSKIATLTQISGEAARALPDSRGGEEPKDLQRWRTDAYELFTTTLGESVGFYYADQWVRVKLTLETAGPVSIGIGRSDILPVLSGKGRLLTTDEEWEVYVPKGARVYYAAENVNRVAVTIDPIPWMEQLSMEIRRVAAGVAASASVLVKALTGSAPAGPPPSPSVPATLARKTKLDQLTPMDPPARF